MVRLEAEADPAYMIRWQEYNRKEMETAEIKNGRLAMLAITGYAFQEALWGTPVVDQTPIFFTFFGGAHSAPQKPRPPLLRTRLPRLLTTSLALAVRRRACAGCARLAWPFLSARRRQLSCLVMLVSKLHTRT